MVESELHVHVLNSKLNPEISKYLESAYSELQYGWEKDMPHSDGEYEFGSVRSPGLT